MTTTQARPSSRRSALPSPAAPLFRLRDAFPRSKPGNGGMLPPGQRAIGSYPRYGTHFARRDPSLPARPRIELAGSGVAGEVDGETLRKLRRTEVVADFHCVAGWTARDVHWAGTRVRDLYESLVAAGGGAVTSCTH